MTRRFVELLLIGITILLTVIVFQNCSPNSFSSSGGFSASSKNTSSNEASASDDLIDLDLNPDPETRLGEAKGQEIVASIYSESDGTTNICKTIHTNSEILASGYFDEKNYSSCSSSGIPQCLNGSQKIILSQAQNGTKTKYHTVCVKQSSAVGYRIVATLYSRSVNDDVTKNECLSSKDSAAAEKGYFDLGNFSYCDSQKIPQCSNGSKKVILSMSELEDGSIKYHTGCIVNGSTKSKIVASIYSESSNNIDSCLTASDASAAAAGYFDLGNYSACENGIPVCKNGSRKIIQSMTQEGSKIKYHTNCIVDTSSTGDVIVATIYSSSVNAVNTCKTAASGDAQAVGYFDLGNYAYCDATNTPQCRGGARKIILSDSQDNQGNVKYHTGCVL